jgi:hypothetical protein
MALLDKTNIINGNIIEDYDVYQMVDALTYQQAYDLLIKGSVSIGSGSVYPGAKMYVSGNFRSDGGTFSVSASQAPTHNILYYNTSSGLVSWGSDTVYVPTSSFNSFLAGYNAFTQSYFSDSASFNNRFISASLGVSASLQYAGRTPATRQVGGINIGDNLSTYTLGTLLEQIVSPYTAPTLSLITLTPSTSSYNQQSVAYSVTFRWAQNVGTTAFSSAQIQYKRGTDIIWNNLTTSVTGISSQKDASASVTVNSSGVNNDSVQFQCIFVDTVSNTTPVATAVFSAYASPTIIFAETITPALTAGGYQIRSVSTPYTSSINGTITRNSPNVDLTFYKVSRDYNDSIFVDLNSLTAITGSGGAISPTLVDSTQPANKNTIRYIGFVEDTHITAGQYVNYISAFNIMQPVLYGMTTATTPASVSLGALAQVNHGTGSAQITYTNTVADKVVNGLSFVASSNRFCVAFDNAYGTLSQFLDAGTSLNLIENFTIGTQAVVFADGTTKTYTVAVYNSVVVSGTYTVNIS